MATANKGKSAFLFGCVSVLLMFSILLAIFGKDILRWYELRPHFSLSRWRNPRGYAEYRHRETGIVMVLLPGGTFFMGSADGEPASVDDGRPRHRVRLGPFLISKYEISQAVWEKVMKTNPSAHRGEELPVENVSWDDCRAFCAATGLSLPSEAQWEYACRAGTSTAFSFGETITKEQVNHNHDFSALDERTLPRGSFAANPMGIHDMHGNVREWCEDSYSRDFYATADALEPDPVCRDGSLKVVRGGGWFDAPEYCRSASRDKRPADYRNYYIGFRVAYPLR